jgi:signal transduction histidine kinase
MRALRLVGKMSALLLSMSHPQTKDRFINALSHELRTPLTSIIGFTQIIRKRLNNAAEKDERLLGQVDVLWSQAQRLNRLIDTFVDVSRLESGQFSIYPGRVEIVAILKQAAEQSLVQARSLHQIIFDLPDHEVEIFADVRRIDQVFNQVLSNAIRFSPEQQPIHVTCEDNAAEGKVIISITDRGPGIPEARIKEIFQRFAASEPLRAGGLGVGLYISKSIIEAHGGKMSLDSYPDKGTTIRIELPR